MPGLLQQRTKGRCTIGKASRLAVQAALVLGLLYPGSALATAITWNGTAGNWSDGTKWSGGGVPTSSDDVTFNSGSGNCTLNGDRSVKSLTINGYTGTIAQDGTDRTLTVVNNYDQSTGTVTAPAYVIIGGTFTRSGGTFTHNSKNVILHSGTSRSHTPGGTAFYKLAITDGLIGYWRFDNTAANPIADNSGYGADLTASAALTPTGTYVAPTFFANPSSENFVSSRYLHLGSYPSYFKNQSWTLSAWIRLTTEGTSGSEIISVANDYLIRTNAGEIRVSTNQTSDVTCETVGLSMADSTWHQVIGTRDATNVKIYLDGVLVKTCATGDNQDFDHDSDVMIGAHTTSGSYYFTGQIDEARIYDRVITAAEIAALAAGGQPAAGAATHTINGASAFSTAHDFFIGSGTLAFASGATISVGGSWWNWGAAISGSADVTMTDTAGGRRFRSNHQPFSSLVFNGGASGAWTQQDSIYGTSISFQGNAASNFTASGYSMYATNFSQTSGTITTDSSTNIIINGSTAGSIALSASTPNIHIEDPTETSLVGYWKFDAFSGNTSLDRSGNGNTATLYNGARLSTTKPTTGFGLVNQFGMYFDGDTAANADYVLTGTTNIPASNHSQTVSLWYNLTALAGTKTLMSLRADGSPTTVGTDNGVQLRVVANKVGAYRVGGTTFVVSTADTTASAWHHLVWTYDSAVGGANGTHTLYVDGVSVATSTSVAPDTTAVDQVMLGGYDIHSGAGERYGGYLDEVRIYDVALSSEQVKLLFAGQYAGLGGGATVTATSNLTATTELAVDSGTLALSGTYTLTDSGTAGPTIIGNGGLTVGSNAVSVSGGLKAYLGGTLTMGDSGTLTVADTKTLTMDGSLVTTYSSTKPSILAASGQTFYFTIGSSATATPTLNIDGLTVQNTTANGMYINTVAGSSTTFTKFDNLAFTATNNMASSYQLRIYATSLSLHGNGLSFDTTNRAKNVYLTGNGSTGGETNAFLGATCTGKTPCESYDQDDDSADDGIGDNTGSDSAVVQWLYRGYTEPLGSGSSISGFPVPAFNWATFAAFRTYVAYNNVAGTTHDRLYARSSTDGSYQFYYELPNDEDFVGSPRWVQSGANYYVYIVTTAGRVYRLLDDNTGAFTNQASSPYRNTVTSSATSPLTMDSTKVYWAGYTSSTGSMVANLRIFDLTHNLGTEQEIAIGAPVSAVPTLVNNYIYTAADAVVYRHSDSLVLETVKSNGTASVSGRLTAYGSYVYFMQTSGTLRQMSAASGLADGWTFADTASHGGTCTSANNCAALNYYFDVGTSKIYYGDKDGHFYAVNISNGTAAVNAFATGVGVIQTAPLYKSGLLVVGSTTGNIAIIDVVDSTNGNNPTVVKRYALTGSSTVGVSSISWDGHVNASGSPAGAYMVGTTDGRLYYLPAITDPH